MNASALLLVCSSVLLAAPASNPIRVNQVGYLPSASKIAVIVLDNPGAEFVLKRSGGDAVALRGSLTAPVSDADSGDRVQFADFTSVRQPGEYYVEVPGAGRSPVFRIGADVYARTLYLAMRAFYGQRCGTAVDLGPGFPGYRYDACHLSGAWHESSGKTGAGRSVRGWHDAGDYGRYVVNSGITTGTLLWTHEMFAPKLQLDIPESGNKTPDLLDEIRWNLDWMLSMQDEDGGVWHKQTSERFCGFVMPQKDALVSYVIGTGKAPYKSSCATADFAAVMAIAARVYRNFDPEFSSKCLRSARNAWTWLASNRDVLFRNPAGVTTGAYGDSDCSDERLWAAAELWRTTREDVYHRYFLDGYTGFLNTLRAVGPPSWAGVAPLGLWTYVLGRGTDREAVTAIRTAALEAADEIADRAARNGYRTSMTATDYIWGSNGVVANYGMQLLVANAMRRDPRYVRAALGNLHYLLGRNTFSLSFVTQVGTSPYRNPHHRPSGADNNPEPWPGLLSGGPNQRRQDPAMRKLPDSPPARMYVDDQESYASNEIAINWQAPFVFLLAGVMAQE